MNTEWPLQKLARPPVSKALVLWDDTNMEKDTLPLTTFVSPRTGVEYLVVAKPQSRMAGGFLEGCPMYLKEYTQYDIVLNGNPVQFCFDEADIASTVEHFENPGADLGSRYD
jgi:hypothetical protein